MLHPDIALANQKPEPRVYPGHSSQPCRGVNPLTEMYLNLSRRRPRASTGRCDHLQHGASLGNRRYVAGIVRVAVGETSDAQIRAGEANRKPGAGGPGRSASLRNELTRSLAPHIFSDNMPRSRTAPPCPRALRGIPETE